MKDRRRLPKQQLEQVGKMVSGLCVTAVTLVVASLIGMVAQQGLTTFFVDGINPLTFLFDQVWIPAEQRFGAAALIVGSFSVTVLATVFALPFALGSAIFIVEIQPKFGQRVVRPLIELLVGIPSVVYGLIGLSVVNAALRALFGPAAKTGAGILSGALVLAVMILPTVTMLAIDALQAVPDSYREGSYALGCTRWQTIWHVVLKSALPSLMTAVVMGMTRAFGETLAVQMVIGGVEKSMPQGLLDPAATLTTALTSGLSNAVSGSVEYHALWSLGLLLMAMSLLFIVCIHGVGKRGMKQHG